MDALILSCGTGGGHDAAAKAVEEELLRRGVRTTRMNPYTLKSEQLAHRIDQSYIRLVQTMPQLFGAVYALGNWYRKVPLHSPVFALNAKMVPYLNEFLSTHHFDVILLTHFFPGGILSNMKLQGLQIPPSILIATDYTCVPLTEEVTADAYVIPADDLTSEFTCRNIPAEKIHPIGIPVSCAFRYATSKKAARKELGLEADKRYLLIAGGSMGAGKLVKVLSLLDQEIPDRDTRFIVICGKNPKLYQRLESLALDRMTILQHTDRMSLYLKACDAFLSKPGGLSTTEAAVSGIPLVHITPIPGCETKNAAYFKLHGMSCSACNSVSELTEVLAFLQDEEFVHSMRVAQRDQINAHAACDICDLAEELVANTH